MSKLNWLAAAGLLAAAADLNALTLSVGGMGQVLEFPYYTVSGNQATLVTLVNSTAHIKALKARFREAYNGRVVAQFNLYLSPFDVWVGQVFAVDDTVVVASRDTTCTVPAFSAAASSANVPALAFSTQNFTGSFADTGPTDTTRLNEGHFEFFEMGEVTGLQNNFEVDIDHVNGVPPGCGELVKAWDAGGVWANDPTADMTAPAGGLYGSEAIVDVANGVYFAVLPAVLDGFSATVQHTAPSSAAPDYDTMSADANGKFAVSVDVSGQARDLHYAKSVDAVSAVFMAARLFNEYETTASLGAQSDWQATFPTKHFYVDPRENTSNAVAPFESKLIRATAAHA